MLSYDFVLGAHIDPPFTSRPYSPPLFGLGPPLAMGGGEAGGLYDILLWVPLAPSQYWPTGGPVALQFHGLAFKGSNNVVRFGTLLAGSQIGCRSGQLSW